MTEQSEKDLELLKKRRMYLDAKEAFEIVEQGKEKYFEKVNKNKPFPFKTTKSGAFELEIKQKILEETKTKVKIFKSILIVSFALFLVSLVINGSVSQRSTLYTVFGVLMFVGAGGAIITCALMNLSKKKVQRYEMYISELKSQIEIGDKWQAWYDSHEDLYKSFEEIVNMFSTFENAKAAIGDYSIQLPKELDTLEGIELLAETLKLSTVDGISEAIEKVQNNQ